MVSTNASEGCHDSYFQQIQGDQQILSLESVRTAAFTKPSAGLPESVGGKGLEWSPLSGKNSSDSQDVPRRMWLKRQDMPIGFYPVREWFTHTTHRQSQVLELLGDSIGIGTNNACFHLDPVFGHVLNLLLQALISGKEPCGGSPNHDVYIRKPSVLFGGMPVHQAHPMGDIRIATRPNDA